MSARKFTASIQLPNARQGGVALALSEIASYKVLFQNSVGALQLGAEVSGPFTQREQTTPPVQPDHTGVVNFRIVAVDTLNQGGLARESGINCPEETPPLQPPEAPNLLSVQLV